MSEAGAALNAEFDAWFCELQRLTDEPLTPSDWVGRWFDGYTQEDALKEGPETDDDIR